jgi:sugar phosphate isomerase/epimerase
MKFGICCGPTALAQEKEPLKDSVARLMDVLQDAGADYVEFPVASLAPEGEESTFDTLREAMEAAPLRVEAMNGFIPAHHRITGPDVDIAKVLSFCDVALSRAHALGVPVVVLGSGGARKVPDGFEHQKALEQFNAFCRELGPVAERHDVYIAIEPLNTREDNLINTVAQGAQAVEAINHPYIQLLADFYHMFADDEPLSNITDSGQYIRHTHLADTGRITAGTATPEADFHGFFKALKDSGYAARADARCSFEGRIESITEQAKPMFAFLNRRWQES